MKINVTFIQYVVGSWLYRQYIQGVNVVNRALCDVEKNRTTKVRYEETEHYQITKSFLDNPDKYFKLLFCS